MGVKHPLQPQIVYENEQGPINGEIPRLHPNTYQPLFHFTCNTINQNNLGSIRQSLMHTLFVRNALKTMILIIFKLIQIIPWAIYEILLK